MLSRTQDAFEAIALRTSDMIGRPVVTVLSIVLVLAWFSTGAHYH